MTNKKTEIDFNSLDKNDWIALKMTAMCCEYTEQFGEHPENLDENAPSHEYYLACWLEEMRTAKAQYEKEK